MADGKTSPGTQQTLVNQTIILQEIRNNHRAVNFRFAVLIVMILIGLMSNAYRTVIDKENREKTQIIQNMQKRITQLREEKEQCMSGSTTPGYQEN